MKVLAFYAVCVLSLLGLLSYHCKTVESTMVQHKYGHWFNDKSFDVDFFLPMMKSSSNTYNSQPYRFQNIWNKMSQDYLAGLTLKNINTNQAKNNPIQIKQIVYYPELVDQNILKRHRRDDNSTSASTSSIVLSTNSHNSTNNDVSGNVNTATITTKENLNDNHSATINNDEKLLTSSETPSTKGNLTSIINSAIVITNVSTTSSTTLLVEINKTNHNQLNDTRNIGTNKTEDKIVDGNTKFSIYSERKGPMTIIFLFAILILITGIVLFIIYKKPFRGSRNNACYEIRSVCHSSRDEATPV